MKKTSSLIFVILFLTACNTTPTSDSASVLQTIVASTLTAHPTDTPLATPTFPEPSLTPTLMPTIPPATPTVIYQISEQDLFQVIALPNLQNELLSDIYVHNFETGEEFLFTSLENINREHYHIGEYHHGNLYIINQIGSGEDWFNELWRFDSQGNEKLLASEQGLDFRVAPDESYIAVKYNPSGMPAGEKISFIQSQGKVKKKFNAEDLGELGGYYVKPLRWSDASSNFWAARHIGPKIYSFHKIESGSWSIINYNVSLLPINDSSECNLNSNTGRIAFSDHPAIFDTVSAENFIASKQTVTLFVYDLNAQELQTISTSIAKRFAPKWINENTIEYNDPNSDGRIIYVLP